MCGLVQGDVFGHSGSAASNRGADGGVPFTSDLSGQAFYKLLSAGYRPLGLVVGNCVYHVAHQSFGQLLRQVGQNAEVTVYSQALHPLAM